MLQRAKRKKAEITFGRFPIILYFLKYLYFAYN